MPRSTPDLKTKIAEAALRHAGQKGWNTITLESIAMAAKVPFPQAKTIFADKNHVLPAIIKNIDYHMFKSLGKADRGANPRDLLFEAFMTRLDLLQQHRNGIISIIEASHSQPMMSRFIFLAQAETMRQILSWSGIFRGGCKNSLIFMGLLCIYYRTIWYWKKDTSPDMARTMAALDQGLRLGNKAVEVLFRDR